MEALNVYLSGRLAGVLSRDDRGRLSFQYDADYLASGREAVSVTFPLSVEPYQERDIMAQPMFVAFPRVLPKRAKSSASERPCLMLASRTLQRSCASRNAYSKQRTDLSPDEPSPPICEPNVSLALRICCARPRLRLTRSPISAALDPRAISKVFSRENTA